LDRSINIAGGYYTWTDGFEMSYNPVVYALDEANKALIDLFVVEACAASSSTVLKKRCLIFSQLGIFFL